MEQNATSYSMNLADDLLVNSVVYVRVSPFSLCPVICTVTRLVARLLERARYTEKEKTKTMVRSQDIYGHNVFPHEFLF